jgi:hypothetical protein
MDPQAFAALQQQALSAEERLRAGGADTATINALMGPLLGQLQADASKFGLAISPDLEKAIAESGQVFAKDKAGEMADDVRNQMVPALWQLVELQGGVAPAIADLAAKQSMAAQVGASGNAQWVTAQSFAEGTGGWMDFGSGTPAWLHGQEAVIRPEDLKRGGITQNSAGISVNAPVSVVLSGDPSGWTAQLKDSLDRNTSNVVDRVGEALRKQGYLTA